MTETSPATIASALDDYRAVAERELADAREVSMIAGREYEIASAAVDVAQAASHQALLGQAGALSVPEARAAQEAAAARRASAQRTNIEAAAKVKRCQTKLLVLDAHEAGDRPDTYWSELLRAIEAARAAHGAVASAQENQQKVTEQRATAEAERRANLLAAASGDAHAAKKVRAATQKRDDAIETLEIIAETITAAQEQIAACENRLAVETARGFAFAAAAHGARRMAAATQIGELLDRLSDAVTEYDAAGAAASRLLSETKGLSGDFIGRLPDALRPWPNHRALVDLIYSKLPHGAMTDLGGHDPRIFPVEEALQRFCFTEQALWNELRDRLAT
ncbi:MAG TPA: hypothetical protein VGG10_15080 [Rhizomicrobium sp.]|jgi:hypothetical protein